MNARKSLTMALAAGSVLLAGLPLQQTQAAVEKAQAAMLTIDVPANISLLDDGAAAIFTDSCAASWSTSCMKETKEFQGAGCTGAVVKSSKVSIPAAPQSFTTANTCSVLNNDRLSVNPSKTCAGKIQTITTCAMDRLDSDQCWEKVEEASVRPQGGVARETVIKNGRLLKYGFPLGNELSINGTDIVGLTVTMNDQVRSEENGTLSLELDDTVANLIFNGANGANGTSLGHLTSTNGSYNAGCTQEKQPGGVSVREILGPNPSVGSCASKGEMKDSSYANDQDNADWVMYNALPILVETAGTYKLTVAGTIVDEDGVWDDLPIAASKMIRVVDCRK